MEKRKALILDPYFYQPVGSAAWIGRTDGKEKADLRWHQVVQQLDLNTFTGCDQTLNGACVFLGFACDEGVKRNSGRVGAALAPAEIRKACSNFPVIHGLKLFDAGDIICPDTRLEQAQDQLAQAVKYILSAGGFPLLLGGGHEIAYGHFSGLNQSISVASKNKKVGIINMDAHFDVRQPDGNGPTSGTGFWQIAEESAAAGQPFNYLAIGINPLSNTQRLFQTIEQLQNCLSPINYVDFLTIDDYWQGLPMIESRLKSFLEKADHIYLSIDLDVFAPAFAPGVSASNYTGIFPDKLFFDLFELILDSGKVSSADIAELNPAYDIDHHTAKLAAAIVHRIISKKSYH